MGRVLAKARTTETSANHHAAQQTGTVHAHTRPRKPRRRTPHSVHVPSIVSLAREPH